MKPEEKFDGLMRLAEFKMGIREKRIAIGYRVVLGIWAVLIAGAVSLKDHSTWPLALLAAGALGIHAAWEAITFAANERDSDLGYFFFDKAKNYVLSLDEIELCDRYTQHQNRDLNDRRSVWTSQQVRLNLAATALIGGGIVAVAVIDPPKQLISPSEPTRAIVSDNSAQDATARLPSNRVAPEAAPTHGSRATRETHE